jgi:hypothetical protein
MQSAPQWFEIYLFLSSASGEQGCPTH